MNLRKLRKVEEKIFITISRMAIGLSVLAVVWILVTSLWRGLPSLNIEFITLPEVCELEPLRVKTGIANAIAGTFLIASISIIIATPIGFGTAIYTKKYAKNGPFLYLINQLLNFLAGAPSIIVGLFGLFIFVFYLYPITGGFSLMSGSLALIFVVLPVIERAMEESIEAVPKELEYGSYALGATKWQTLKNITIPNASAGILTGTILGIGVAIEQSAVVILTAGYSQFFPRFGVAPAYDMVFGSEFWPVQEPIATLPIAIFNAFRNPLIHPESDTFATAFVLILLIIILNGIIRILNSTFYKKVS